MHPLLRKILDPPLKLVFTLSFSVFLSVCFTIHNLPDLSIIGWDASPEAMSAVDNLIETYRDVLCLSTDTDCFNCLGVNDVISYFEHNPLKYCVLVADADKIKAVLRKESGISQKLLQIADRNVGKFLCYSKCSLRSKRLCTV